jgi:hypothetical protein
MSHEEEILSEGLQSSPMHILIFVQKEDGALIDLFDIYLFQ